MLMPAYKSYETSSFEVFSEEAKKSSTVTNELQHYRDNSLILTSDVESCLVELDEVRKDHSIDNWGGEDEIAISPNAICAAQLFIHSLPRHLELPEIGAEYDGSVALAWCGHNCMFTISVMNSGKYIYTFMSESNCIQGVFSVERLNTLPDNVVQSIQACS